MIPLRSVFESIEKHARTKFGYTSLAFVDEVPPPLKDEMPRYVLITPILPGVALTSVTVSYFLAETSVLPLFRL